MIGKTISHYKILEKLGEGGMGVVYKAHDNTLDRIVALKFLPHYLTSDKNEKERFYHEAKAAASLMHQNVAVIHEIGEHEGQVFISMEYVEGKTLKQIIEQENDTLSIKKVLDIAIQICDGLTAAHEKGIVHRDIKSDNIMLTAKGQVKIMDFGLAKIQGATKLTQTGSTVGTAAYMSPEQAQGIEVDNRSDIFSFGVVLYEILTTHLPFKGDHQPALIYSLLNEDPQPAARYNDKVSQELEHIVFKALEKDREERYQHVDDMLADLRKERKNLEYARTGYVKASSISQQRLENKADKKKNVLKIIISVSVVIILAVVILYFNPFGFQVTQNSSLKSSRNSLAVMYFENIPDPGDEDHTGEMLTNLLITSLSQVKGLEVISRERLLDIQKQLGHTDTKTLSPSFAGEVANHAGVNTMLIGSILQKNPALAVTTRLIDVQSGRIISSQKVTNFPLNKIFALVDSLTYLLEDQFRTSSASTTGIKPVAEVTTRSTEAYRAYIEGLNLWNKLYLTEAKGAFKRAVELDNNFAMAYFYLALMQRLTGERFLSFKTFQKAAKLADNTAERDRLLILAMNYRYMGKTTAEEGVLQQLTKQYPHEIFPYIYLNYLYLNDLLIPQKIIENCLAGLKNNPSAKFLLNYLAYAFTILNRKVEALNTVDNYIKLAPAEPNPYDTKGDIYAWFADYDSSQLLYKEAINLRKDFSSASKLGFHAVIDQKYKEAFDYFQMSGYKIPVIEINKGQIRKSLEILKDSPGFIRKIHLYYEIGKYQEMLRLANEFSDGLKVYPDEKIYRRDYVAWALIKNGKISEAYKLLNEIKANIMGASPRLQLTLNYCSALVLFEEGKYGEAVKLFEKAFDILPPNHEPNIFYSISLLKNGQLTNAINEFQRLTNWPNTIYLLEEIPGAGGYWPIQDVKAHYWLGVAYEIKDQKEKALKEYKKFLDIWKDADFESHELNDAKKRIQKIGQEVKD